MDIEIDITDEELGVFGDENNVNEEFIEFSFLVNMRDRKIVRSDSIDRINLMDRFDIENAHIDSFARNYKDYIERTLIPQYLTGLVSSRDYITLAVQGEEMKVFMTDVADMRVNFVFEAQK